jgi:hypothetical protein
VPAAHAPGRLMLMVASLRQFAQPAARAERAKDQFVL